MECRKSLSRVTSWKVPVVPLTVGNFGVRMCCIASQSGRGSPSLGVMGPAALPSAPGQQPAQAFLPLWGHLDVSEGVGRTVQKTCRGEHVGTLNGMQVGESRFISGCSRFAGRTLDLSFTAGQAVRGVLRGMHRLLNEGTVHPTFSLTAGWCPGAAWPRT